MIDTNILLDIFLNRIEFLDNSRKIFDLCKDNVVSGKLAAHTITNLFYILRKNYNDFQRRGIILSLFEIFDVVSVDKNRLVSVLEKSNFKDFEDSLQDECAYAINADYIITRNTKDFEGSMVKALTPEEFLEKV
ncbi:PIN domain-containing protein [Treponema sp.]|uniref:PIN domain-containing protein n=1 Tax=Treponema sp. TaxID=166 RepID=UPI00298D6081|nr:PIN domain-containing protein [Treponema sp.]MCQ2240303.1 PIN domain-containing protein [Treponema sp.]